MKVFKIYMYRNKLNACSRNELYLIMQTTRVINNSKQLYLAAKDLYPLINGDEIKAKRYVEVLYHQASAIYEVLYVLDKDLLKKYNGQISDSLYEKLNDIVSRYRKKSDKRIEVLKDIRNKHGYHIAYDNDYIWKYITDKPSRYDLKIGIGNSTIEQDLIYTMDNDLFVTYIMDKYSMSEIEVNDYIKKCIKEYADIIIDLFRDILEELLKDKIYLL